MPNDQKLSLRMTIIASLVICLILFFCAFNLKSHLSIEWDEGVYLTTFQSVQHGFPIYQQTYLSQPPGFFMTIFPLYAIGGSTLEAARLAMFFYSVVGLIAIMWIGWELDSILFSFIAIGVLYSI